MTYIKHNGNFYKQVDLKKMTKEELVDLITNAIEVEPQIIERWNSYPIYRDYREKYKRWDSNITRCQNTYLNGDCYNNSNLDQRDMYNNLMSVDNNDLITLCKSI